ncbi:MAG TPA: hypothetical protein V6D12_01400 [Candidatus Obscuribacterales bacterium]
MDWTNFEQVLRQLSDLQVGFVNNWVSTMPNRQSENPPNFRETFDKTLKFQEEVVTSSLEFQALVARQALENQKQYWEAYFNMIRKA